MCGCPGVCEGAASEFPLSPVSSLHFSAAQVQGRRCPGTGREDASCLLDLAGSQLPALNSLAPDRFQFRLGPAQHLVFPS